MSFTCLFFLLLSILDRTFILHFIRCSMMSVLYWVFIFSCYTIPYHNTPCHHTTIHDTMSYYTRTILYRFTLLYTYTYFPYNQDGRLQEGDKIISIDGRQAWCLTCGQVARCLRQNDSVLLGIHRPDRYDRYDYVDRSLYCGSRRVSSYRDSVSSASPRSTTSSTSSYSQVRCILLFYCSMIHILQLIEGKSHQICGRVYFKFG